MSIYDPITNPGSLVKNYGSLSGGNNYPSVDPLQYNPTGTLFGNTSNIQSGQAPGMSSAEAGMVGAGVGGIIDMGLTAYQGHVQSKENEKNRAESRAIAEQTRSDTLKQNDINFSLKQKIAVNEEKAFALQKKKDNYDLRYNRFITNLEKMITNRKKLNEQMQDLFSPDRANELQQFFTQARSGGK